MKVVVRDGPGDALPLMERVHSGGLPLAEEYPLVFQPDAPGRVVVAEEEGRVLSTCAVLERVLHFPDASGVERSLPVGLIGSVTTAEEARGRGLASAVLDRAEAELAARGCALALLWADDPSFYERRGYRQVGAELDFLIGHELASSLPPSGSVTSLQPGDEGALHELYSAHGRRAGRSPEETRALLATPGMTTAVARDAAGRPDGYACLGRGHDLEGVVHEWGGDADAVLACLRGLMAGPGAQARDLFLMAPPEGGGVADRLAELGAPVALGVLAMARVLDPAGLAAAVAEAGGPEVHWELASTDQVVLSGPGGVVHLRPEELLESLVPTRLEPAGVAGLERALGVELPGLPWAPFLWGLDSI